MHNSWSSFITSGTGSHGYHLTTSFSSSCPTPDFIGINKLKSFCLHLLYIKSPYQVSNFGIFGKVIFSYDELVFYRDWNGGFFFFFNRGAICVFFRRKRTKLFKKN